MKYRFTAYILLFILMLSGCTSRKDYEVLTVSGYDTDDTILIKDNVFFEDVDYMTYTNESAEKSKQFEFFGREYSLQYMHSVRKDYTSYYEDTYVTMDEEMFYFKISSGNSRQFNYRDESVIS